MPSEVPMSQPSARDRRAYFRINVGLPISIQTETDRTEGALLKKSVNISGGGLGVTVNVVYKPDEVLSLTLILPDKVIFTSMVSHCLADNIGGGLDKLIASGVTVVIIVCFEIVNIH